MGKEVKKETLGFETEVNQLLKLMVHSLYSNKEIFLRELISNASDAADKLRFEALSNSDLIDSDAELSIRVVLDPVGRTLSVSDNGIGMNRQEVIDNIGTIAKSGTREFFEKLTGDQSKDAQLIGQFGVGFYSSFIVADKVTLITRRAGDKSKEAVKWESTGEGGYTIEEVEKESRGTEVLLHLRKEEDDFLETARIRSIIQRYSDHITLPILMEKEEWDDANKRMEKKGEDEKVNQASALWIRPKSEIKDEQYEEFYRHVSHDFEKPLAWTHSKVEGRHEYTQLLYLPSKAPFDFWNRDNRRGIKLYVNRVFIMDDAEQLIPSYLRFVKGLVDSNDLPLNVSREILQKSKDVEAIRKGAVNKILGLLEDLEKNNSSKYQEFWNEFGKVLKEGVGEDANNKERIAKLLRFSSTNSNESVQDVSLLDYLDRMKDDQDKIYYITAENFNAAKASPHLEIFREKGIEVLLLYDRVDEWFVAHLPEFQDKKIVSIAKGELDLGKLSEEEKKSHDKDSEEFKSLVERISKELGDKVQEVRVSSRLKNSPACIVTEESGMSTNLNRLLKEAGQEVPELKPILEINPSHPILMSLKEEGDDGRINDWSNILLDQATLAEGGILENPSEFVQRLNEMLLSLTGNASKIWTPNSEK